ncbi:hypothetical protein DSO57_1019930 [Entomophthora muscae]|uniref:Uncharacterized protein n=1 Tax=Entomophthora muscae TaxID=34485 RepID=A0ACC2RIN8_9FUNG|nr:hypothetical protein DSO57_1019930 [Entomophthora muscae]
MAHRNLIPQFKSNIVQADQVNYQSAILPSQNSHEASLAASLAHISSMQSQQAQIQANRAAANGMRGATGPQRIAPQPSFLAYQNPNVLNQSFAASVAQASNFNFHTDAIFSNMGQDTSLNNKKVLLPKKATLINRRPQSEDKVSEKDASILAGKVRALRTAQSEMAKVERAQTEELLIKAKDPSLERAARKNIRLRRAAEKAEMRAQMEAIQQNRYRPVYYYQPSVQFTSTDPTAEATTFNGRFRKIVPKDPSSFPQQL